MRGNGSRDVAAANELLGDAQGGRAYVAVIGIDRYRSWNRLYNAVSDASGALGVFSRLGFEPIGAPLFDELATGDALHRIVTDDLTKLGKNDSLVLFFAGHGHTMTRTFYGGATVKDGYIIPVDGDPPGGSAGTWMRLESWLKDVTRIPAQHILVVLDACHSGLALGPVIQWRSRGMDMQIREPLHHLRARRSRRIITSALDDQRAMDGGPVPGHSLFTGCLIEGLTSGLFAATRQPLVTGSQIGFYVQRRVIEYPNSTQTPDFGALELDDRGELVVRLTLDSAASGAITLPVLPALEVGVPEPTSLSSSTKLGVVRKSGSAWRSAAFVAVLMVGVSIGALTVTGNRDTASIVLEPTQPAPSSASAPAGPTVSNTSAPAQPTASNALGLQPIPPWYGAQPAPNDDPIWSPVQPPPGRVRRDVKPLVRPDAGSDHVSSKVESNDGSDGGSNGPALDKVVLVTLFAKNDVAFEVFEHGVKLFDGPDDLEVRNGEKRTVVIKARGFKDKTVVVTGTTKRFQFALERVSMNVGTGSGHITPKPPPNCNVFSQTHGGPACEN